MGRPRPPGDRRAGTVARRDATAAGERGERLLAARAGGAVAAWYDAVRPQARRALAERPRPPARLPHRPRRRRAAPVLQFDGRDDVLVADVAGLDLHDFTLFVVAAPFSNAGGFRALLSANERGKNDYTTGVNVDLGSAGGGAFDKVNVEGRGFPGEKDLTKDGVSFPLRYVPRRRPLVRRPAGRSRLHLDGSRAVRPPAHRRPDPPRRAARRLPLGQPRQGRQRGERLPRRLPSPRCSRTGVSSRRTSGRRSSNTCARSTRRCCAAQGRPVAAAGADARAGIHRARAAGEAAEPHHDPLRPRRPTLRRRLRRRRTSCPTPTATAWRTRPRCCGTSPTFRTPMAFR